MNRIDPRIRAARAAIRAYEQRKGTASMQEIPETLCDLLTDLRHYCAAQGVDFEAASQQSESHFAAESEEREP